VNTTPSSAVKDDHVLWLELLCRSCKNTHLVAHTGPTLRTSGTFFEALLQRRPEAITYLPSDALELHSDLVDAVVADWTRAGKALRCLYSGPNYNNLLKRILAVHGRDPRAVAAFASVSWLAFDDRLVVHSEPSVQLVEVLPAAVVDSADHHHELQSLKTRVTDLEAQVKALTCELGCSQDHICNLRETITRLHRRDRHHNYNGGPWSNKNNKRRRDYN
jgi:cell division protein FtsB